MLETNVMFRKVTIGNQKLRTLTDDDIKDIQLILREMLIDFDAVCRKNGLTYFLCGGTELGAVRHGGFIEWDDDADICLPRKDYDKLWDIFTKTYNGKYHIQSIDKSDTYDLTFMKIRKNGTKYVELFETEPEVAGVFIDVYPIENVPDNSILRLIHGAVSDFLHLCCSCVRIKTKKQRFLKYFTDKKAARLIKIKAFIGTLLGFFNMHKWCLITQKWASCCKNVNSKFISFPNGRKHYFGEMCMRNSFFPPREVDFDGIPLYIMNDPSEYLTKLYGDYTEIPPIENREHHSILQLDLGEADE